MPSRLEASRPIMPAIKAAASAPSSSSPPVPRISCTAPRASPPPGNARSIAARPNGSTPCAVAVGRSIRRTRSRSVDRGACDMLGEDPIMFLFCSFNVGLSIPRPPRPVRSGRMGTPKAYSRDAGVLGPEKRYRPFFSHSARRRAASAMSSVGAGEGEADPAAAADRVEIEAGGDRDAGLGQQTPAEFLAVAGQFGNVDIKIERPVGRRETRQARGRKNARSTGRGWRGSARHGRRARRGNRRPGSPRAATGPAARCRNSAPGIRPSARGRAAPASSRAAIRSCCNISRTS